MNIPSDFHWKIYLQLNKDLNQKADKKEVIRHYLEHGIKEGRKYKKQPSSQEWDNYLDLYQLQKEEEEEEDKKNNQLPTNTNTTTHTHTNNELIKKYTLDISTKPVDTYEAFLSEDVLVTKNMRNSNDALFLAYTIDEGILETLTDFIFVIDFHNGGGGTTFFLNCIVSKYKKCQTFVIARNFEGLLHLNVNEEYNIDKKYDLPQSLAFLDKYAHKISKIFVNHTLFHPEEFIQKLFTLNRQVIGITHDYYTICTIPQPLACNITATTRTQFLKYDYLLTQHPVNIENYNLNHKYSFNVIDLPDYHKKDTCISFARQPHTTLAILGNIIDLKGMEFLKKIIHYFKNSSVKIIVIGYIVLENFRDFYPYTSIAEFNEILAEHKPNAILELTIWPETYSYTLSMAMITDLPIFYLKKSFRSVVIQRLQSYPKAYGFSNLFELKELVQVKKQDYLYTIQNVMYYNTKWNDVFMRKTHRYFYNEPSTTHFKYNVQPYFIYFPQFHSIPENNLFFYENFNDMKNLVAFNNHATVPLEAPLLSYLGLKDAKDYNLLNTNIVKKQAELVHQYGFKGFAVYYYWFTTNNISNQHMIMENVVDQFFKDTVQTSVFFIWANENWTNNLAFGINSAYKIENEYNEASFRKNAIQLIPYFKHANYLKIKNKPVFFIYHNYLLTDEQVDLFYHVLKEECIRYGFSGLHLVLNSFCEKNAKYPNFYVNFNYKKYESRFYDEDAKQIKLNYKEYMDNEYHTPKEGIKTIALDFDNRPRLFQPNRLENSTMCVNNTEINKVCFIKKMLHTYKKDDEPWENLDSDTDEYYEPTLQDILLINSFNEWGEKMTFEPSDKYGYYNLNLLYDTLKK